VKVPQRVLVDARFVTTSPASSHARYLRELTRAWASDDDDLEFVLFAPGPLPADVARARNVQWRSAPPVVSRIGRRAAGGRLWLQSAFTIVSRLLRPDLLFFPYPFVPSIRVAPAVVTLHDVCFRTHSRLFADAGQSLDRRAADAVAGAEAIIAVSEASNTAATAAYGLDPARVHVVHHGISPVFDPTLSPHDARLPAEFGLGGQYLLCVSTHEPRKNLELIADAFVRLVDSGAARDARLVLVGHHTDYTERVRRALGQSPEAEARTHLVASLNDHDLAGLYRRATAVLAPTHCEGFGFPVIEALACGTPVLASDLCVFRELVGDAASYLPVDDVDAWTAAMGAVLVNGSERREAAQAAALAIRTRFTWAACAAATKAVLAGAVTA
jgi:glycosyltransferase involved in cell wall biosynthesis